MIGEPNSARAVGTAIARNEVAFIIPCHRVIKANGVIGEYRWGIAKKQTLLCYEAAKNPKSGGGGG
jgi:AraC family transcriptional regulator of adaptative response/methylated-DNA-[protein]-cysteine methyltransferase